MMGSVPLQVSWAPHPVTLIDTEHRGGGAPGSALSEPISFTRLSLSGRLSLSQAIGNAAGGREEGAGTLLGLIELCLLLVTWFWGNLCNLAEPLLPDL